MSINKSKISEKKAVCILTDLFLKYQSEKDEFDFEINGTDKIPFTDGYIEQNKLRLDIQLKAISLKTTKHVIKEKYLKYANQNALMYIYIISVDSCHKIFYKFLPSDDIIINNNGNSESFLFRNELNAENIDSVLQKAFEHKSLFNSSKVINDKTFIELLNKGCDLKMNFKIPDDNNYSENIDVISDVLIKSKQGDYYIFKKDNLKNFSVGRKEEKIFKYKDNEFNTTINRNASNDVNLVYKNLSIVYKNAKNIQQLKYTVSFSNLSTEYFEMLELYILFFEMLFENHLVSKECLDNTTIMLNNCIKLRNELKKESNYNNIISQLDNESLSFLLNIDNDGLLKKDKKTSLLVYKMTTSNNRFVVYNVEKHQKLFLESKCNLRLVTKSNEEIYGGAIIMVASLLLNSDILLSLNFNFKNIVINGFNEIENKAESLNNFTTLLLNCLNYYYLTKDNDINDFVKGNLFINNENDTFINKMQLVFLEGEDFNNEEYKRLIEIAENGDIYFSLCASILLRQKKKAKDLFESLDNEKRILISLWPITKLYYDL